MEEGNLVVLKFVVRCCQRHLSQHQMTEIFLESNDARIINQIPNVEHLTNLMPLNKNTTKNTLQRRKHVEDNIALN